MTSGSKKVVIAALIGNALVAIVKFIASLFTGSSAMISEGIHSVVDTSDQLLLLLGMKRAKKPPDAEFPYGYGKEVYFWSFVVALMVFLVGAGLSMLEGVQSLLHPKAISDPSVNYIVLALAAIFESTTWYISLKEFRSVKGNQPYFKAIRQGKDPTKFVVLFEDSAALLGLVTAFLGIFLSEQTGIFIFDGIASVVIGLILGVTAFWLAYETKGLLIGESADPRTVEGINEIIRSYGAILTENQILTMHVGPNMILVNLSVDFKNDLNAGAIERAIAQLTREIKNRYPRVKRVFIEAEGPLEAMSEEYMKED
jgi:cation diffusion facilitator family transporter